MILNRKPILAIDFDDTVAYSDPENNYKILGLREGAKEYISLLSDKCEVIIWTCRYSDADLIDMKNFLEKEKVHYDYINRNSHIMTRTGFDPRPKIFADIYIDDRGLYLPEWKEIYRIVCDRFGL